MLVVEFSDERNCVKSVRSLNSKHYKWSDECGRCDVMETTCIWKILWSWKNTQNIKHDKWSLFSSLVRLREIPKNYIYFVVGINILRITIWAALFINYSDKMRTFLHKTHIRIHKKDDFSEKCLPWLALAYLLDDYNSTSTIFLYVQLIFPLLTKSFPLLLPSLATWNSGERKVERRRVCVRRLEFPQMNEI